MRPESGSFPGDDAFRFRHLLIRDAAYEALPKAIRAQLHERFAAWLEERAPELVELDEILGYHLEQAARYRAELGTPSAELAGAAAADAAGGRGRRAGDGATPRPRSRCCGVPRRCSAGTIREAGPPASLARAQYVLGRLDESYAMLDEAIERGDADLSAHAFFLKLFAQRARRVDLVGSSSSDRLASGLQRVERTASGVTLAQGISRSAGRSTGEGGSTRRSWRRGWRWTTPARAGERTLESESLRSARSGIAARRDALGRCSPVRG